MALQQTNNQISAEWLYATPKQGKLQRWIERSADGDKEGWYINPKLKGRRTEWIAETRKNTLLLSLIGTFKNHDVLKNILNTFIQGIFICLSNQIPSIFTDKECLEDTATKGEVLKLLKSADLGIIDLAVDKEAFCIEHLPKELPSTVKDKLCKELQGKFSLETTTMRKKENGDTIKFEMEEESEGTKRLYALAYPLLDILNRGTILIVDEISNSIHFKELELIETLFLNPAINPKGAQLVFTTHDISVLHRFNREEIYFTDKEHGFHTQLYPLTDFENRGDVSIYNRYTQGLYFALPKVRVEQ